LGYSGVDGAARGKVDPLWEEYSDTMREMWARSGLMPSASPHVNDSESFGDLLVDGLLDAIRSYRVGG
jgi:hypothetical protein